MPAGRGAAQLAISGKTLMSLASMWACPSSLLVWPNSYRFHAWKRSSRWARTGRPGYKSELP
jgi:hypothetical protein